MCSQREHLCAAKFWWTVVLAISFFSFFYGILQSTPTRNRSFSCNGRATGMHVITPILPKEQLRVQTVGAWLTSPLSGSTRRLSCRVIRGIKRWWAPDWKVLRLNPNSSACLFHAALNKHKPNIRPVPGAVQGARDPGLSDQPPAAPDARVRLMSPRSPATLPVKRGQGPDLEGL